MTQPFAGAIADRFGSGRVILAGLILIIIGTLLTPFMTTTLGLIFTIGVLAAGGAGMAGPSVLMGATARLLPAKNLGMATGIVNAGGSFGQFAMAPLAIGLTVAIGWQYSMQSLGILMLLALPAIWVLKGSSKSSKFKSNIPSLTTSEALKSAITTPSYLYLAIGFLICGFHVAFLATHLPGFITHCGMSPNVAGWSLAMIGLFNIFGSLSVGWAIGHWRMKSLLSLIYLLRACAIFIFLFAPKTPTIMLIFAAVMGITFLSTVPPTAGLVAKIFGYGNMALLFGVLMLSHQIGGFLGALLGGYIFELEGNYNWMWYIDIALALFAAVIHLPIREEKLSHNV
ncbi:MAG: MFS transporter [Acinetobacter populi]|nr:MFS transporter [Acinetobacter populi]MCH4247036.1 MFS transporter [Acinetobacter populi]